MRGSCGDLDSMPLVDGEESLDPSSRSQHSTDPRRTGGNRRLELSVLICKVIYINA
jgi:hypothetical protein